MAAKVVIAALLHTVVGYTWPDSRTDYLETILYQQTGYRQEEMAFAVVPCSRNIFVDREKRIISAEWFRTAYHDMATADVEAGTGGIDGSIGFETDRAENVGTAFNGSTGFFVTLQSARGSMADLIALGAQMSLASCSDGNMQIPYRAGRIDATEAGPPGVPEPQQDLDSHTASFKKQGFNVTEMIGLVACGHSIGGVHGVDFPDIVDHDLEGDERQDFDQTVAHFDNVVAKDFVGNISQNPLAFGHNHTTRSDARIFNADGGDLIHRMAESNDFFIDTCKDLVERMLNTVPRGVELTAPIEPVVVKPDHLWITINDDNTKTLGGEIRVHGSTSPSARRVLILVRGQGGGLTGHNVFARTRDGLEGGGLYPNMPTFTFYEFETTVPAAFAISFFAVDIIGPNGFRKRFDNNGAGLPWVDAVIPQIHDTSCRNLESEVIEIDENNFFIIITHTLRLVAAMRDAGFEKLVLSVPRPVEMPDTLAVRFEQEEVVMDKVDGFEGSGYARYEANYSFKLNVLGPMLHYDLIAVGPNGNTTNAFNPWKDLRVC
ncbi:heme peroxidase [Stachybotrys elegans]|uniref:Peroxidase n=1 Tax=Stachybotrys elegans TaxID=80388 RepID=A0A8K0WPH5_9HYPO|nr:heme peroxidase [Stachybotrys elegans]